MKSDRKETVHRALQEKKREEKKSYVRVGSQIWMS